GQDTPQLGAATSAMRSTSSLAPTPDIAPHEPQRQQQVNHIPEGNYGSSWAHKTGQVHSPMTIRPDGTPAKNIPTEDKINKASHNRDSWVTSGAVQNLNPAQTSATPAPMRARSMGQAPREGGNN